MKRQVQIVGFILGIVSFAGGLADVYMQWLDGGPIHWRVPLILIGTGISLPLLISPFFEWDIGPDPALMDEEQYAQIHSRGGVLGTLTGTVDSGDGHEYSDSDDEGVADRD